MKHLNNQTMTQVDIRMCESEQTKPAVLVCITDQISSERLIASGAMLAQKENCELIVLNVQETMVNDEQSIQALEELFRISTKFHASMHIQYDQHSTQYTKKFIQERNIKNIVVGMPDEDGDFVSFIQQSFPHIFCSIIPREGMVDISFHSDVTIEQKQDFIAGHSAVCGIL